VFEVKEPHRKHDLNPGKFIANLAHLLNLTASRSPASHRAKYSRGRGATFLAILFECY
jgi:hypothetical protein